MKLILLVLLIALSAIDLSTSSPITRIGNKCYITRFDKIFKPGDKWCEPKLCGMCEGRFNCQVTCSPTVCEQRVDGKEFCKEHMKYLKAHHINLHVDPMGLELQAEVL